MKPCAIAFSVAEMLLLIAPPRAAELGDEAIAHLVSQKPIQVEIPVEP